MHALTHDASCYFFKLQIIVNFFSSVQPKHALVKSGKVHTINHPRRNIQVSINKKLVEFYVSETGGICIFQQRI